VSWSSLLVREGISGSPEKSTCEEGARKMSLVDMIRLGCKSCMLAFCCSGLVNLVLNAAIVEFKQGGDSANSAADMRLWVLR